MSGPRDTPLAIKLKARIMAHGPIVLSRFMAACLWDEDHGYYVTRHGLGAAGDFVTAPEISQMFGELLGLWAAVVWQQMGSPAEVIVAEAGPGRGTLMRDALRAIERVPAFETALRVVLIEASPTLRAEQRATLAGARVQIEWRPDLPAAASTPLIVIANELLDCRPIDQAVKTAHGWRLRGVGLDADGRFTWVDVPPRGACDHMDTLFALAPLGAVAEFTDVAEPLGLRRYAATAPVAALYIDYGHTAPSLGDTLQAVRNHRHEAIFDHPGEADLSAHVDFAALAAAAHGDGFAVDGPVTQADFLGALGLVERASRLMAANPSRANEIETSVARLIAPHGMGTRFKAIGLRSPWLPKLPGF